MFELRWSGKELEYRQRAFQVDATGAFCGLTEFGPWKRVEQQRDMPPFITAAKEVIAAYEQHGVGAQFPELESAIEKMQTVFESSVWSKHEGSSSR